MIEMLISMALATFVLAGVVMVFSTSNRSYVKQDQVVSAEQNVRGAMEIMAHEFRMAGYIPLEHLDPKNANYEPIAADVPGQSWSDGSLARIEEATANTFTFVADLNANNNAETVRYTLTGTTLTRQSWEWDPVADSWSAQAGGQAVNVAEDVTGLNFTYTYVGGVAGNLDNIRAVTISMTGRTQSEFTGPGGSDYRYRTLRTYVKMRNMGLDVTSAGS